MKTAVIFIALVFCGPIFSKNLALEIFEKGNALYEKGEFDSAAAYYERVLSIGRHDARVYFNLGNAHFRKNRLGLAILNYEKAKRLSPADGDIDANLAFANLSTVDKIPPRPGGFLERLLWRFHTWQDVSVQAVEFLLLLYLLTVAFLLWITSVGSLKALFGACALVLFFFLAPLSISLIYKMAQEDKIRSAVALAAETKARNAPDGDQILFTVHEGAKLSLSRKIGTWYLAGLDNGLAGWVMEEDLGLVEIFR